MIDDVDYRILHFLQTDARTTNAAIAKEVGLTGPSVYERIKKLEQQGIIQGYTALVNASALGRGITAFIRLSVKVEPLEQELYRDSVAQVAEYPEVLECHSVAGEDCLLLKVKVASPRDLEGLIGRIRARLSLERSVTMIVLSTYKEDVRIALPVSPSAA